MMKEPEIKLFGRKIFLPENSRDVAGGEYPGESSYESNNGSGRGVDCDRCLEVNRGKQGEGDLEKADGEEKLEQADEDQAAEENSETTGEDKYQNPGFAEESKNTNVLSESDDNPKTPSIDEDVLSANHPKTENEQTDAQQKTLKKPDKILPCPRCNSMDTKFCYYNNYNVNQPRHFCKSCQRYWTAGGMMRNVPVGAGRRKNKHSASNCRHITISEAFQAAATIDAPNGFHDLKFKPNGTVLSFGPDSTLCESISSALNLAEKRVPNGVRNVHHKIDQGGFVSCKNTENGDKKSSVTTSNSTGGGGEKGFQQPVMQNINGFAPPVPCIPGAPGPFPWNFPWNSAVPLPAICPPGFAMPFYPSPYWNCGMPNALNLPWLSVPSPTANQKATFSGPNSPLGKHSRNGELLRQNNSEGKELLEPKNSESSIVVPKTLRIDDPEEAAKSSIWSTLGIKYDSISREGLFKALQPKSHDKKSMVTSSSLLQANPAALSRSVNFQEIV